MTSTKLAIVLVLAAPVFAQDWRQAAAAEALPALTTSAMAYDSIRHQVVLFGRLAYSGVDPVVTAVWEGSNWTVKTPLHNPPLSVARAMAFDAARGEVVLFGGFTNDTWVWNGADWTQRLPANSPPARLNGKLVYDAARGNVVLFGGSLGATPYQDTWTWNGVDWTERKPAVFPSAHLGVVFGYDAQTSRAVLYGGAGFSGARTETWLWDGKEWNQVMPAHNPGVLNGACTSSGRVLVYGGRNSTSPLANTWTWEGADWKLVAAAHSPEPRDTCTMAFDAGRGEFVLQGGSPSLPNTTWVYGTAGTNVTPQVQTSVSAFTLSRVTGTMVATVTVKNIGTSILYGPLTVSLLNLPSQLTAANPTGVELGVPYVTLNGYDSGQAMLFPGNSATVQMQLPQLTFTPAVFSGVRPPL